MRHFLHDDASLPRRPCSHDVQRGNRRNHGPGRSLMMKRFVRWMAVLIALGGGSALAQNGTIQGYCDQGGVSAQVSGLPSTNKLQGNIPSCTITVYLTGTQTKATIFSNPGG